VEQRRTEPFVLPHFPGEGNSQTFKEEVVQDLGMKDRQEFAKWTRRASMETHRIAVVISSPLREESCTQTVNEELQITPAAGTFTLRSADTWQALRAAFQYVWFPL
jgi:hypothetical protein